MLEKRDVSVCYFLKMSRRSPSPFNIAAKIYATIQCECLQLHLQNANITSTNVVINAPVKSSLSSVKGLDKFPSRRSANTTSKKRSPAILLCPIIFATNSKKKMHRRSSFPSSLFLFLLSMYVWVTKQKRSDAKKTLSFLHHFSLINRGCFL